MKRLLAAGLLLFGATIFGCGGSTDETNTQPEIIESGQTPLMGGNEAIPTSESPLQCPKYPFGNYTTPEEAAVDKACTDAHRIKEIDFAPLRVELSNYTANAVNARVVGYSETCDKYCPGEVRIEYELYRAGEFWKAKDKPTIRFEPTDEREVAENQNLVELIADINLSISTRAPRLDGGNFCATVTANKFIDGLWYRLLVDLPNGQTDIVYMGKGSQYLATGTEDCFSDQPGSDGNYSLPFDIQEWNGQSVNVKAYQLIVQKVGATIEGDWVYFDK